MDKLEKLYEAIRKAVFDNSKDISEFDLVSTLSAILLDAIDRVSLSKAGKLKVLEIIFKKLKIEIETGGSNEHF